MSSLMAIPASTVSPEELRRLLADHIALDQARVLRRLLVVRCGSLAAAAAAFGLLGHGASLAARCVPPPLFLAMPLWAWVSERRLERRLARHQKVIKSS